MSKTILSTCESQFVLGAAKIGRRLDGRDFEEYRSIELHFGSDYGCAYVTLGETKALAQVSCELGQPRPHRPNEGSLHINLEINEMVSANFETGDQNHLTIHANRLLEKCFKDSNCIDLEALCIVSEQQVWDIRVDVTVLNSDGNMLSCCSIAALAALAHFRTPYVKLENSEIKIHSVRQVEPQPLSIHHYPILVSFVLFNDGNLLLDPTEREERVCESGLVIGMNSYRELCGLHFSGKTTADRSLILKASTRAGHVAAEVVTLIKTKLAEEAKLREEGRGRTSGLVSAINLDRILSACQDRTTLNSFILERPSYPSPQKMVESESEVESSGDESPEVVVSKDPRNGGSAPAVESNLISTKEWVPSGRENAWKLPNEVHSDSSDDSVDFVKEITDEDRIVEKIELTSESEEDVVILETADESYMKRFHRIE